MLRPRAAYAAPLVSALVSDRRPVSEAKLERTDAGLVATSAGWFVLNARDARWIERPGRGHSLPFTGWSRRSAPDARRPLEDLARARRQHPLGERLAERRGLLGVAAIRSRTHSYPPAKPGVAAHRQPWPSSAGADTRPGCRRSPPAPSRGALCGELDERGAVGDPGRGGRRRLGVAARAWSARQPCPGAGIISSAPKRKRSRPRGRAWRGRRRRGRSPSYSPAASLPRRVSTLPRSSAISRSGAEREQLRTPAQARGADPGALGELGERAGGADEGVGRDPRGRGRRPARARRQSRPAGPSPSARRGRPRRREAPARPRGRTAPCRRRLALEFATATSSAPPSAAATASPGPAPARWTRVAILTGRLRAAPAIAQVGTSASGASSGSDCRVEPEELAQRARSSSRRRRRRPRASAAGWARAGAGSRSPVPSPRSRSRSASVSPSQRRSFSARTRSTISSARARSAATVGVTSWAASHRSNRSSSASGSRSARRASASRPEVLRSTSDWRSSMSWSADAGELAAGGVDVARHGEVDQQQRPAVALVHHLGERLALDHVVGRARRGDDDVGVDQQRRAAPRSAPPGRRSAAARPIARS